MFTLTMMSRNLWRLHFKGTTIGYFATQYDALDYVGDDGLVDFDF